MTTQGNQTRLVRTRESSELTARVIQTDGSPGGSKEGSQEVERNVSRPNSRPSSAMGGPKFGRDVKLSSPSKRPLSARAAAKGFESRLDDKFIDLFSP